MTVSKAKTFRNVIYTSLTKGATLLCTAIASSVVARNLTPSDYGVVGFAGIIIGFLSHFSDVGVGSAAIRSPNLDQRGLRTAFTLKIMLSFGAFAAAWIVAPFAHYVFEHPATANVIRVLSLDFLISTIGFMSLVTLTREQNYRALFVPGVIGALARGALSIALILLGWKYWAVVFADVGANIAGAVAMQVARKIPLRTEFDWPDARDYLRFGIPLLGSGILIFLLMNMDNFLVGSRMGSTKLGYYALAFTWGSFICGLLYDTVNSVLLPAFAAIQNDANAMRRWYLKTIDLVAFAAVIANTALLANVRFFLVTFLGKGTTKWMPAATALEILCFYGILRVITEPIGNCIMARGHTRTLFNANGVAGILELILILLVLRTGRVELVAAAVLVAYAVAGLVLLPFLRRELCLGIADIGRQLWPVAPALVAGYVATHFLPGSFGNTLITLAARGAFTAVVVAITHGLCTQFRCFQEVGEMVSQNFARIKA